MEEAEEILIRKHIDHDEELKRYVEDHERLEADLEVYNKRIYLTPDEQLAKKQLQKRKLLGKEKIFQILAKYRTG
jgi:uncharacterized protein